MTGSANFAPTSVGSDARLSAQGRARLEIIQIIRAVAALLVVVTHGATEVLAHGQVLGAALWAYFVDRGQFGVDLFFIVSGFILTHISRTRLRQTDYPQRFIIRRIARVVPVYWFYLTLMVALTLIAPQSKNHTDANFPYILASYLFIPFPRPSDGAPEPILGLGWTLNYEMYFYLVFFIAMILFRARALLAVLTYFVAVYAIGQFLQPENLALSSWTGNLLFEFGYGIVIALAYDIKFHLSRSAAATLFFVGVLSWLAIGINPALNILLGFDLHFPLYRGFIWGIPAGLVVASLILGRGSEEFTEHRVFRLFAKLGDASFSLYLVHLFVMRLVTLMLQHVAGLLGLAYPVAYFGVFVAAAIVAAFASYRLLERPAERGVVNGLQLLFRI